MYVFCEKLPSSNRTCGLVVHVLLGGRKLALVPVEKAHAPATRHI